ncbi:IS630 family transposase [Aphanothece hegewaldii]|uniref:IS630 family transposase n=1 Tax=Aphanothece hegewaldii TaxID=1521625 RepID=UPI001C6255A5|nr:IS630 family transposase [Aphanothece hegewaldii]
MGRKAHLENYLSSEQLKERYRQTKNKVESRRWHLLWLVSEKWKIKEAAAAVGYNYDYAKEVIKAYNEQGEEAIKNKPRLRKKTFGKALLNEAQLEELRERLKQPPPDQGIWTGPKVAHWIAQKIGREKVWPQRGWDYLKKFRYSLKVPRPRHQRAETEQQEQFKKRLPEQLKQLQQKNPTAKIELWSFDEHRIGLKPILRRVWTPRGERPIATVNHRYEWLYLYSFVHPQTGQTEWFIVPKVNVEWFNLVLQSFATAVGAGQDKIILLVLDRAGWHMSEKVKLPYMSNF